VVVQLVETGQLIDPQCLGFVLPKLAKFVHHPVGVVIQLHSFDVRIDIVHFEAHPLTAAFADDGAPGRI
jgi:hypothetical protein